MLKKYLEDIYYKGISRRGLVSGRYYEVKGKTFLIEKHNFFKTYNTFLFNQPYGKGGKALITGLVIRPKRYYYLWE